MRENVDDRSQAVIVGLERRSFQIGIGFDRLKPKLIASRSIGWEYRGRREENAVVCTRIVENSICAANP